MRYFRYIILVAMGLALYSCDDEFLNPLPDSAIVVDAFFVIYADIVISDCKLMFIANV